MATSFTKIKYNEIDGPLIDHPYSPELDLVVVIPAFAEIELSRTLHSLSLCHFDSAKAEVIVLINQSDQVSPAYGLLNEQCFQDVKSATFQDISLHIIYIYDIPEKLAGVGTARKLAMDEAVLRLNEMKGNSHGIIVNLDADCTVSQNYLEKIRDYFQKNRKIELCSIHFEHDLEQCKNHKELHAITSYELHLRYFIGMQKWLALPYAFQTVGSAFAVRSGAYVSIGGMNRRKAGEDFYFIHKFSKKGTIGTLNTCTVYPSPRSSFRVPFGTGKAIQQLLESNEPLHTYHPQSFINLQPLVGNISLLCHSDSIDLASILEPSLCAFLESQNFEEILAKLRANSKSLKTFMQAFFQWFDAFRLMKYLHFMRDCYYENIEVKEAINLSSGYLQMDMTGYISDDQMLLGILRKMHKRLDV